MENKTKKSTQVGLCLLVLLTLCAFAFRIANAQKTDRPDDIPEGYTLIDGDILLPTGVVEALRQQRLSSPDTTPKATYRTNLWPNGVVPFEFDANVTAANQTNMLNAMTVLENVANVDFQQCGGNNCAGNSVHVQSSTGNNSQVGLVGGEQVINIVSWGSQFIIVHELQHCLGFFHEHTRPDRNTFVQINCNNVQGGCGGTTFNNNFVVPGDASAYGYYDFDSLQHYDQCSFSIDCAAGATCNCVNTVMTVLTPNQSQQTLIGQRTHLSALDQATVSFLYPFGNWRFLDCTYNGGNGTANGTFRRPYTTFASAIANTPAGGTLWVLNNCFFPAVGTYSNQVTIRVAPGVTATLGG